MKDYINGDIWDFEREIVVPGDRPVILGLDGGATSTICVCMPFLPFSSPLPDPLPFLSRAVAGCSNHNSVGDALSKSGSSCSAVQAVCLAVSGVNHPTDEQRILNWLRDIFPSHVKLYVQNDAVAALASGIMGKLHGCVLIAGIGTIAYGFTECDGEARAAGAGPILGDWGCGYGIATQALTAVIRAHDGLGPETILTSSILQTLDLCSPDELIRSFGSVQPVLDMGLALSLSSLFHYTKKDRLYKVTNSDHAPSGWVGNISILILKSILLQRI